MHIEEAVQWVEMNKRIIINFSRKYLQFTPYDRGRVNYKRWGKVQWIFSTLQEGIFRLIAY